MTGLAKADETRDRILNAATTEFAAYGIAGARVDRIAGAASINKRMIYVYFGSKEKLFEAVLDRHVLRAIDAVPFSAENLVAYAGDFFDYVMKNSDLMRLIAWYGLEKTNARMNKSVTPDKVAAIKRAQKEGKVSSEFPAAFILSSVAALGTAWIPSNTFAHTIDPNATKHASLYRESIKRLVKLAFQKNRKGH